MEIIAILAMSIIILAILVVILKINKKNMMEIKKIGEDKDLNEITNVLPENEEICKEILKMLGNEEVNIKSDNTGAQESLYIVANNSILISNTKSTLHVYKQ